MKKAKILLGKKRTVPAWYCNGYSIPISYDIMNIVMKNAEENKDRLIYKHEVGMDTTPRNDLPNHIDYFVGDWEKESPIEIPMVDQQDFLLIYYQNKVR